MWALVILLYILGSDKLPEPPEYKEYSVLKCEKCGRIHFGDSYDAPNYCSNCGGKMIGETYRQSNPEHDSWQLMQNARYLMINGLESKNERNDRDL